MVITSTKNNIKCGCGAGLSQGCMIPERHPAAGRAGKGGVWRGGAGRLPDPSPCLQVGAVPDRNQINHIFRNPRMYWYFFNLITRFVTFVDHIFMPDSTLCQCNTKILLINFHFIPSSHSEGIYTVRGREGLSVA